MKILYALQGTGNGHLSRARDIIPILLRKSELDILISGTQADVHLPYPIEYRFKGLSFVFGKNGGIDLWETYKKANLRSLFEEVNLIPIQDYDLVINDFEPVSAWACYLRSKECIALSHQAAVMRKSVPQVKGIDVIGRSILKNYAPATSKYGFHFQPYDKNIFTPVVRREVRDLIPENKGYYTVYLPAYSDKRIINVLSELRDTKWQVFSKHSHKRYKEGNISVSPINNVEFMVSMAGANGVICGAGFETPAEAIYLGKKLLVIPMKNQVEQKCNAAALKEIGIPMLKALKKKYTDVITDWIASAPVITIKYPDITEHIVDMIIQEHTSVKKPSYILPGKKAYTVNELRKLSLKKILLQLVG